MLGNKKATKMKKFRNQVRRIRLIQRKKKETDKNKIRCGPFEIKTLVI